MIYNGKRIALHKGKWVYIDTGRSIDALERSKARAAILVALGVIVAAAIGIGIYIIVDGLLIQ